MARVDLILGLKDLLTIGVKRAESFTRQSMGGIGRDFDGASAKASHLGATVNKLHAPFASMGNAAANSIAKIGIAADEANRKVSGMYSGVKSSQLSTGKLITGSFLGGLGAQMAMRAGGALIGQGKDVLHMGMEAGAMQEQFKVLAGEKDGMALYGGLKKYIADSVFGPELYGTARTMMAYGIAAKDVLPDLKMLGDVSMGDKEKLDLLTYAFSQTASAGKLMGQDLMQYTNAGFNPLQVLAEKTGRSMAALRDDMSRGAISTKMVHDAFVIATSAGGRYHRMLEKIGDTPYGKYQQMMGSWDDVKVGFGMAIAPSFGRILDGIKPYLDKLSAKLDEMAPTIDKTITGFAELIPTVAELGGVMLNVAKPFAAIVVSQEFKDLAKGIGELGTSLGETVAPLIGDFASALKDGLPAIKDFLDLLPKPEGKQGAKTEDANPYQTGAQPFFIWDSDLPALKKKHALEAAGYYVPGKSIYRPGSEKDKQWQAEQKQKQLWGGVFDPGSVLRGQYAGMGVSKSSVAVTPPGAPGGGKGANPAAASTAERDAITGGGRKTVNIYMNRPMVEKQIFQVGSMREAMQVSLSEFQQNYLRVIQSAVAAL